MKKAGKTYDPVTYEGAGHGFMRAGEDPADKNPANKKAAMKPGSVGRGLKKSNPPGPRPRFTAALLDPQGQPQNPVPR